jgi:hypothetical protein
MPGDEHWDPGGLNYPVIFEMVSDVLNAGGDEDMGLSEDELEAVRFANGQLSFLEGGREPPEAGPKRRGYRFARSIKEHLEELTAAAEAEPTEALPDDAELKAMREYHGPQEHHAGREEEEQGRDAQS